MGVWVYGRCTNSTTPVLEGLEDEAMNQSKDKTLFLQLGSDVRKIHGRMLVLDCGISAVGVKADLLLTPMYCYIPSSLVWKGFAHMSAYSVTTFKPYR